MSQGWCRGSGFLDSGFLGCAVRGSRLGVLRSRFRRSRVSGSGFGVRVRGSGLGGFGVAGSAVHHRRSVDPGKSGPMARAPSDRPAGVNLAGRRGPMAQSRGRAHTHRHKHSVRHSVIHSLTHSARHWAGLPRELGARRVGDPVHLLGFSSKPAPAAVSAFASVPSARAGARCTHSVRAVKSASVPSARARARCARPCPRSNPRPCPALGPAIGARAGAAFKPAPLPSRPHPRPPRRLGSLVARAIGPRTARSMAR